MQFSLKALLVATGLLAAVLAFWRRSDEQSVTTVPIGELGKTHGAPTQYRLLPNCGLVSDDTEHACMVAQALIAAGDDADRFANELGRRLRKWLLGAPAGIGLATLKASVRLCLGVPPYRSGVFSAGNGPAMRSPLLGAAIGDVEELRRFVRLSTRVTHTDPKAEWGAMAVALAARAASQTSRVEPHGFASELRRVLDEPGADEMHELIHKVAESVAAGASTESFAASLGLERGVSGYIYHTVPVVLHAWLANPGNFRAAVTAVICCGGDADTTAAITGGIVGSAAGKEGIPADWLARFTEWPRTVAWMERLAVALCEARTTGSCAPPPRLPIYGVLPRNAFFASLVLGHGFRRLLPPY
ncbi:MAG TPA: ADP-ribosylglycohydrolase family protein [Pirellulales bacterium]|nr:ADP-ribosylglycohydrolase family protein [Pirellulales bacterium]